MTSEVPLSIRPDPVMVEGVPPHTVAIVSVTSIATAPSAKTWTVFVCVPPSASLGGDPGAANGLVGSLAGVPSEPRSRTKPIAASAEHRDAEHPGGDPLVALPPVAAVEHPLEQVGGRLVAGGPPLEEVVELRHRLPPASVAGPPWPVRAGTGATPA